MAFVLMATLPGDSCKTVRDRALAPPIYPENSPESKIIKPQQTRYASVILTLTCCRVQI